MSRLKAKLSRKRWRKDSQFPEIGQKSCIMMARLNEDAVSRELSTSVNMSKVDIYEHPSNSSIPYMRDLNEERITFFDKSIEEFENEISVNNGAFKEYTSLKYFKIKSTKHKPIKRDIVE
jgi:hypothetical protein